MALERGTLLHKRYRIIEILGQGGMGSVYRAMDENLGVEVALKENLFTTDEYSRQFRLEAVILANLRHPNLPRVTDHFVIGEQGQYLVMDYIEGEDLRQRMERIGYIPEEDAIQIGAAVCDALGYLHSRKPPIIHRDVKPGNVKITPDGHIFLVDFGLAKVVHGSQATTTGARAMTPGYSPPEQYGTARTDARTDIYSLGATLYAALCGVIPEDGLARAMDNAQLTPLRKRNAKVSRRLAAVIEKAMAVYPEERFQTAEEFKKALLGASTKTQRPNGDYIVTPPPAGEAEPKAMTPAIEAIEIERPLTGQIMEAEPMSRPRPKRRGSGCISIAALVMLFLILAIASAALVSPAFSNTIFGLFVPAPTATLPVPSPTPTAVLPTNTPAPTALPTLTPIPTQPIVLAPTDTPTPTNTPTGGGMGQIAFVSDRSGVPQIYLLDIQGGDARPVTNLPSGACQPDWSPDGERLVFVSPCDLSALSFKGSALYTIKADGSELYQVPISVGGDYEPSWSPDGHKIAFTSLRDGYPQIYVFDIRENSVLRLTNTTRDFKASQPSWSRFGNMIVYALNRYEDYQIWKMDSNGLGQEQLVRSGPTLWDFSPFWSPITDEIYFHQRTPNSPLNSTWLMKIGYEERGGLGVKVDAGPKPILNAHFSPDGLWLVFNSVEKTDGSAKPDIYIISLVGGERQRLTTDRGNDIDPVWRPTPP